MVLRLQTAEGIIKEYPTVIGVGCTPKGDDSYDYEKWVTKCGIVWQKKPEHHQECDHLECAICSAECGRAKKTGAIYLATIAAMFFVITVSIKPWDIIKLFLVMFFVIFAAASILHWGIGLKGEENLNELTEYRDKGTINGIKTRKISSQEETKTDV